jgi:type III secretion protein C
MLSRRTCARSLWQVAVLLLLQAAGAAEIHWRTSDFSYVAQNKPLKEFIREFAAEQGLNVVIAQDVEGTVNGKFNLTPQSMLDLLASSFGVTWYYDGNVLYVSSAADMSSQVLPLGAISADQLQAALNRLNIAERRYPVSYDRAHNTARVAGPKRYVDLVKETVAALNENGGAEDSGIPGTHSEIRVFPLRYAWAADFSYSADGQEHTLPGIVSVLRDLYTPTQATGGTRHSARLSKLDRMRGLGYFRDDQVPGPEPERLAPVAPRQDYATGAPGGAVEPAVSADIRLPQFQADGRMNAVIVRDVPERMAFHEAVIHSLDVRPGLVEIEARILEVSSDSISSLGVSWSGQSGSASVRISQGTPGGFNSGGSTTGTGVSPTTILPNINTQGLTTPFVIPQSALPVGGVLTTVLGDAGHYLMARVNALAEDGKARIVSTPKVLTLDNVEAVLENLSTFYVPVAGNLDVGLYNVSAGISLRVTPLIVTEGGRTEIKLAVRVEDGGITQQSVSNPPVVQRSTITTQAFINEGESLLIGGFRSDVHNDTQVGVPGLSSIPVLGQLFKRHQKEVSHVERLFMVTPRVVQR